MIPSSRPWLLALLCGVLLTAVFPPGPFPWAAWIALLPLLEAVRKAPVFQAFRLGYVAGVAHFLTLLYWVIIALGRYGNLTFLESLGPLLLLSLYLALYLGAFASGAALLRGTRLYPFWLAALWVMLEYLRSFLLTGFPWCLLGYSQVSFLTVLQAADLFGVYGLSGLLVLANGLIHDILIRIRSKGPPSRAAIFRSLAGALMVSAVLLYGHLTLQKAAVQGKGQRIHVRVVQGNIDQSIKWDPEFQSQTVQIYERLSLLAAPITFRLVVWPETALPFFYQDDQPLSRQVKNLVSVTGADLLFGGPAYIRRGKDLVFTNRVFLLPVKGSLQYYDKVHLVPFGEYVPLGRLLPFVQRLVPSAGNFVPGKGLRPLRLSNGITLWPLVCFESIFPELTRRYARQGVRLLANLTNDAWFGRSSAPYQHYAMAVFRAVESRLPLIRAANTGISAVIDPWGRAICSAGLFKEAVLDVSIPLHQPQPTFYHRWGYRLPQLASALVLMYLAGHLLRLRKRRGYGA